MAGIVKLVPALGNQPATVSVVALLLVTTPLTAPAVKVVPTYALADMFRLVSVTVVAVNVVPVVAESGPAPHATGQRAAGGRETG